MDYENSFSEVTLNKWIFVKYYHRRKMALEVSENFCISVGRVDVILVWYVCVCLCLCVYIITSIYSQESLFNMYCIYIRINNISNNSYVRMNIDKFSLEVHLYVAFNVCMHDFIYYVSYMNFGFGLLDFPFYSMSDLFFKSFCTYPEKR